MAPSKRSRDLEEVCSPPANKQLKIDDFLVGGNSTISNSAGLEFAVPVSNRFTLLQTDSNCPVDHSVTISPVEEHGTTNAPINHAPGCVGEQGVNSPINPEKDLASNYDSVSMSNDQLVNPEPDLQSLCILAAASLQEILSSFKNVAGKIDNLKELIESNIHTQSYNRCTGCTQSSISYKQSAHRGEVATDCPSPRRDYFGNTISKPPSSQGHLRQFLTLLPKQVGCNQNPIEDPLFFCQQVDNNLTTRPAGIPDPCLPAAAPQTKISETCSLLPSLECIPRDHSSSSPSELETYPVISNEELELDPRAFRDVYIPTQTEGLSWAQELMSVNIGINSNSSNCSPTAGESHGFTHVSTSFQNRSHLQATNSGTNGCVYEDINGSLNKLIELD
uniref:Uncharacterized protein n=1 Tax=Sphaerodactylus townsendi TaxID=933632 RepID=A0ACB8GFZ4_9SAUR